MGRLKEHYLAIVEGELMPKQIDDEDLELVLYAIDEAIDQATEERRIVGNGAVTDSQFIRDLDAKIAKLEALKEKLRYDR